jgi:DNA-binding Xre family transcriptional regulator
MTFGYDIEKCKRALVLKSLDQKDLAEEGLSESVISKFFRGEDVRHKTANRIIEKLGLEIEDVLLDESDLVGGGKRRRK